MKPKLTFIKTQVTLIDEGTNNKYDVVFSGQHTDIHTVVFCNGKEIERFIKGGGHANKTAAIQIVNDYLFQKSGGIAKPIKSVNEIIREVMNKNKGVVHESK